jgi:hypothetical protein
MKNLKLNLRPLEGPAISVDAETLYIHDAGATLCIVPDAARQMVLLKGGRLVVVRDGKPDAPIVYGEAFLRFDEAICTISVFG